MNINIKNSFLAEKYNISTEGQSLFIQRWIEMFNIKTIDTYKPRLTNTHSILEEYVDVLKKIHSSILLDIQKNPIHSEANKKIKYDSILKNNDITLYNSILGRLNKKKGTLTKQIDDLEILINELDSNYINWILKELKNNIDKNNLDEILDNIESLSTELISNGWSKRSLYRLIKKFFYEKSDFEYKWNNFRNCVTSSKVEFKCYIKVEADKFYRETILGSNLKNRLIENVKNSNKLDNKVKTKLIESVNNILKILPNEEYFIFTGYAYSEDLNSFIDQILEELAKIQSEYSYFNEKIRFNLSNSIVILPTDRIIKYKIVSIKESFKNQGVKSYISIDKYKEIQDKIRNTDIETRLSNILNQYRLGFNSDNVENWFSSLWFALESLVSTQHYETIIDNIINIVCPIATLRYPKTIIKSLVEDLSIYGINLDEIILDNVENEDIIRLIKILKDENLKENLKLKVSDHSLLCIRIESISKWIRDSSTIKHFLENHYENLTLHLRRLYRVRNSFVHIAKVDYDLYPITMHLHSYLIDVLDEIFNALDKGCTNKSIERIYSCSDLKYRMLIDKLDNQKERNFDTRIICFDNFCDII